MSSPEADSLSPREESPGTVNSDNDGTVDSDCYQDSGVALNLGSLYKKNANSNGATPHATSPFVLNMGGFRGRGSISGPAGTPLTELRRPSIVDMVHSGGLIINQQGSCEIKLENVNATDIEQIYADAYPGGASLDGTCESNWKGSEEGSLENLTDRTEKFKCPSPRQSWWSPKFNSAVLEKHLGKVVIEFLRRRFRIALVFIGLFALLWIVVFSVNIPFSPSVLVDLQDSENLAVYSVQYSLWYVLGGVFLFVCIGVLLIITFTRLYAKFALVFSIFLAVILMLCSFSLALALHYDQNVQGFLTMSFVAQFAITAIIIMIIFTLSRMPIWLSIILSLIYLIILEVLVGVFTYKSMVLKNVPEEVYIHSAVGRNLFYICLVLAGVSTAYLSQVRQHATFWKIAQCVLSQKVLDLERELEEKTILSMMPKHFADGLMNLHVQMVFMFKQKAGLESDGSLDPMFQSISTPFNLCSMDSVTILFADIVDFTEFSSSLSAAELVGILNDVFSMFDDLVSKHSCEKISTLGDCYFCVSGCPEPAPDHADNCVDMGLAIIDALDDFRRKAHQPIEMRVGIHTGSVFCGVMGTKRFKFDVWSKDVRIANRIESVSTPGRVLISSKTKSFLSSSHVVEEAHLHHNVPELESINLYYAVGKRSQAAGNSVIEWRKKINTIDTVAQGSDNDDEFQPPIVEYPTRSSVSSTTNREPENRVFCPLWRKKRVTAPVRRPLGDSHSHSSSSIVDIFSKQKQLMKCTSYAELAIPNQIEDVKNDFDEDIVKLMEEQKVNFDAYFDPQLKIISLQFHDSDWEVTYRNYGRDLDDGSNGELTETELGYRITKLSYLIDTVVLFINFLLIMIGSAVVLSADPTFDNIWKLWLAIFLFGLFVESVILLFVLAVFKPSLFPARFSNFATYIINWYARSFVALFMIYYPMAVVCVSITQCQSIESNFVTESVAGLSHVMMTFYVTIVVLISSINFMEVSHIVKFVGGCMSGLLSVVMVVIVHMWLCIQEVRENQLSQSPSPMNETTDTSPTTVAPTKYPETTRVFASDPPESYLMTYYTRHVAPEAIILMLLILILLAVVNRMSEVSVRLSFIARIEASARRRFTRQLKTQAEWLLYNIIPPHVAMKLKTNGKFSQNHKCVGVIFASIVNFREFLLNSDKDEESLRVLNQIITEFDALLDRQRFSNIEKIKTIGSTYMAASGLNLPVDQPCHVEHLLELLDFATQLIEVLELINKKRPGFVFRMRIGFNYGPITSGVVGSQKMLYDIWGDTVNVASRMDTTGMVNKIHMPEECLDKLQDHVAHSLIHKVIDVKGKGQMRTVFVSRPVQSEQ